MNEREIPEDDKTKVENIAKKTKSWRQEWKFYRNKSNYFQDIYLMIEPMIPLNFHLVRFKRFYWVFQNRYLNIS